MAHMFSATCQDSFGYSRRTHPKKTRVTTVPVEELKGGEVDRGALPGQKGQDLVGSIGTAQAFSW